MHVGVAGGDFGVVTNPEKHASKRKTTGNRAGNGIGQGAGCERRIGEGGAGEVVREQIQILMAEVPARFEDMTPLDERPIVSIFVSCLNLAQGMAEGIFAKALEFVTAAAEAWSAKVEGVTWRPGYLQLLHNIGIASVRA